MFTQPSDPVHLRKKAQSGRGSAVSFTPRPRRLKWPRLEQQQQADSLSKQKCLCNTAGERSDVPRGSVTWLVHLEGGARWGGLLSFLQQQHQQCPQGHPEHHRRRTGPTIKRTNILPLHCCDSYSILPVFKIQDSLLFQQTPTFGNLIFTVKMQKEKKVCSFECEIQWTFFFVGAADEIEIRRNETSPRSGGEGGFCMSRQPPRT